MLCAKKYLGAFWYKSCSYDNDLLLFFTLLNLTQDKKWEKMSHIGKRQNTKMSPHAHTCGCGDFCANRCGKFFRNVRAGACVNCFLRCGRAPRCGRAITRPHIRFIAHFSIFMQLKKKKNWNFFETVCGCGCACGRKNRRACACAANYDFCAMCVRVRAK